MDNYVASVAEDTTEVLRADPFERAFAIKWVTGLIARADVWAEEAAEGVLGAGEVGLEDREGEVYCGVGCGGAGGAGAGEGVGGGCG